MGFVVEGHTIAGKRSLSLQGCTCSVPHNDKPHAERKQITVKQKALDLARAFDLALACLNVSNNQTH